jgi:hypothetical protein
MPPTHPCLLGSKTRIRKSACVVSMNSFFELIVFERRLTGIHHDGVEL